MILLFWKKLHIIVRKSTPCFWFPPPLLHWPIRWTILVFFKCSYSGSSKQWNFSVLQPACCYCVVPSVQISPTPPTQHPSQWLLLPLLLPQPILPPQQEPQAWPKLLLPPPILYLPILPPQQEPLAWPKLLVPPLLLQPVLAFSCLLLAWSIFAWCGSLLPPCQGVPLPECYCTKNNASALCSFLFLEWTTDIFNNNLWWEYWRSLTSIFHPSERQIALYSPCWLVGHLVGRSASQLIFQQQWSSG